MKAQCVECGTILGESSMPAHMKIHPQPVDPQTCWIVTWISDAMLKEQWHQDRHWPYVEVYMSWGDAFRRAGELQDQGYPSAHWREVQLVGAVRGRVEGTQQ